MASTPRADKAAGPTPNKALPAADVASVDGQPISEAMLDHWVAIQASTEYEVMPKGPIPAGVIPDPPAFRACIAFLRAGGPTHEKPTRARTNAQFLRECEESYHALRRHVLPILISFKWWEAKGKELGIDISQQKIATEFARYREEEYHSLAGYEQYIRRTGQTLTDEYLRMRMDLYQGAFRAYFTAKGTAAYLKYLRELPKEMALRTSCQPSDVNPNCEEYEGSSPPEARI
jgi:hypothetical protein